MLIQQNNYTDRMSCPHMEIVCMCIIVVYFKVPPFLQYIGYITDRKKKKKMKNKNIENETNHVSSHVILYSSINLMA